MQATHSISGNATGAAVQATNNDDAPPARLLQIANSWPPGILATPSAKMVSGAVIACGLSMGSGAGFGLAVVGMTLFLVSTAQSSTIFIDDSLLKWHVLVAAGTALGGGLLYKVCSD